MHLYYYVTRSQYSSHVLAAFLLLHCPRLSSIDWLLSFLLSCFIFVFLIFVANIWNCEGVAMVIFMHTVMGGRASKWMRTKKYFHSCYQLIVVSSSFALPHPSCVREVGYQDKAFTGRWWSRWAGSSRWRYFFPWWIVVLLWCLVAMESIGAWLGPLSAYCCFLLLRSSSSFLCKGGGVSGRGIHRQMLVEVSWLIEVEKFFSVVDCCVVVVFGCNGTDSWGLAWAGSSRVEWGKDDYYYFQNGGHQRRWWCFQGEASWAVRPCLISMTILLTNITNHWKLSGHCWGNAVGLVWMEKMVVRLETGNKNSVCSQLSIGGHCRLILCGNCAMAFILHAGC